MTHALDVLKLEKEQLEKCLSNWDCEQYPEAKEKRDRKLQSVNKAITLIELVSKGLNPYNNGAFEEELNIRVNSGKSNKNELWCKHPNNFIL